MSYGSFSVSDSQTFTLTHAKHMAAKVATDLRRMQRFYGYPSSLDIDAYESELIVLLKAGYLKEVTYGFKRGNDWIEPTLIYNANDFLSSSGLDDDPGRVAQGRDVSGASFYSYLTYSTKYHNASESDRTNSLKELPFERSGAPEPGISGYVEKDKTYSAGGRSLSRSSVRSLK
ncbi:hypothetical protein SME41J_47940 (plasmid) [Serratia marcescens]|nr:hypothetical protein SME41J_47940 [Serratia marcescens]